MSEIERDEVEPGGAGQDGLAGYEYQMDISVWLALQLIAADKQAHELVLEPATQEDLEGELEDSEPGWATGAARVKSYTLVVQAKLRRGDAWSVNTIKSLLEYGGKKRISAAARLANPDVRYLLVTSAALNGEARGLGVRQPGLWPKAADMAVSIEKAIPGSAGRVAVIGSEDQERLTVDIKTLLIERFRVPTAEWEACLKALREEARIRIRGVEGGRWRREELEHVIRDHQGFLVSAAELEHYVKPTNWDDLRKAMKEKHAALIIGQSGTGKTFATKALYEELRKEIPGLSHVSIKLGPDELSGNKTQSPVLFDIEDPWGRYDFDSKSRPWNDQIDQLFSKASHDRLIVATTRRDVALSADILKSVRPWLVPLEAEHYGPAERKLLYESRISALPWDLQDDVSKAEETVLAALATPLEIQKFFDAVPSLDRQRYKDKSDFITEAIRRAHANSIERTVIEQIAERKDVRAASVIWGLLKAAEKFSLSRLQELEQELADRDPQMVRGIVPLVRFFVAARNLRQNEDILTYYHARVEAGIQQAIAAEYLVARQTLRLLVDVWTSLDEDTEWGIGMAARLIAAVPAKSEIKVRPTDAAAAKIDAWLEARLLKADSKFETDLKLAAAAGSKNSAACEVARYLLQASDRGLGIDYWSNPEREEAWYESQRAAATTRPILERFIREVLPLSHRRYWNAFAIDVKRLAPDLSSAFLFAAHEVVDFGVIHSDDAIAEGALDDLAGFEAIVAEALEAVIPSPKKVAKDEVTHLAVVNGEYSDDYVDHISDDEHGYTAGKFLKAYIVRVRQTVGWEYLANHAQLDRLRKYWLTDLREAAKDPWGDMDEDEPRPGHKAIDPEEVEGAFACSHNTPDEESLWYLLLLSWDDRYQSALVSRVKDGSPSQKIRLAALTCLIERVPSQLSELCLGLEAQEAMFRLIEIALDLARLCHEWAGDWKDHGLAATAAVVLLPPPFHELSLAYLEVLQGHVPHGTDPARKIMEDVEERTEDIRRLRLALGNVASQGWREDLDWLLAGTEDPKVAAEAVRAAERNGLNDVLDASLRHKYAAARAQALRAIARKLSPPLPPALLDMASDNGKLVRMALVELLAKNIDPSHMPALLTLARDKYSTTPNYGGDNADLPIARDAVAAIKKYAPLSREIGEAIRAIAISSDAPDLRRDIFRLLATRSGNSGQALLFAQAVAPGRDTIREEAASGLLWSLGKMAPKLVNKITAEVLATQIDPVAVRLALVLGAQGEPAELKLVAEELSANLKRRVLILLLIRIANERDPALAKPMVELLPGGHPSLGWALGGEIDWPNDEQLSSLGEPGICHEVFVFMKRARS